jgi:hypothetical protein
MMNDWEKKKFSVASPVSKYHRVIYSGTYEFSIPYSLLVLEETGRMD